MDVCLYARAVERMIERAGVGTVTALADRFVQRDDLVGLQRLRIAMEIIQLRRDEVARRDAILWAEVDRRLREGRSRR